VIKKNPRRISERRFFGDLLQINRRGKAVYLQEISETNHHGKMEKRKINEPYETMEKI